MNIKKNELISVATYPFHSDRCSFQLEEFRKGAFRCVLPALFREYADEIENFKVRTNDVWVLSFPRSGSTWTQEVVWLLAHNGNPETTKIRQMIRCPLLEGSIYPVMEGLFAEANSKTYDFKAMDILNVQSTPRFIKTHLHAVFLPREIWTAQPKMIYVYRDPRDVAISHYYLSKGYFGYTESLDTFLDGLLQDKVWNCPYWEHVLGYWKLRNEDNFLFIRYSDLKKDPSQVVEMVAKFLGKEVNRKEMESILETLKFENMKANPGVQMEFRGQPLIRKGESGKWKEVMSEEYAKKFEEWIQENIKGTDFVP